MNDRNHRSLFMAAVTICLVSPALAQVGETPDVKVNPSTGDIQLVDSITTGSGREIRFILDQGTHTERRIEILASAGGDDLDPRIVILQNGDTALAWWRALAVDEVHLRRRNGETGAWSQDIQVSLAEEGSRRPVVAAAGNGLWVAYELNAPVGRAIGIVSISDGPEPFPSNRRILATTGFSGNLDTMVHSESDRLWVEWIDGPSTLGWCAYDAGTQTWSAPRTEAFGADAGAVNEARERIRAQVIVP